jgi:hypothetical protein
MSHRPCIPAQSIPQTCFDIDLAREHLRSGPMRELDNDRVKTTAEPLPSAENARNRTPISPAVTPINP